MNLDSQNKVLKAGFMIFRKDDYPQPKIKYKRSGFPNGGRSRSSTRRRPGIAAIRDCCMTAA